MTKHNDHDASVTERQIMILRIDKLATQVHTEFQALEDRILPTLHRIEQVLTDLMARVTHLEKRQHFTENRLTDLESRLPKKTKRKAKV